MTLPVDFGGQDLVCNHLYVGASQPGATGSDISTTVTETTVNTTNLNVGASGTAGTLKVFPSTSAKGSLRVLAADSAGDTVTTITNASQAAARTYTLPDAGAAANFVLSTGTSTATSATSTELNVLSSASAANSGTSKAMITGTSGAVTVAGVATFNANPTFGTGFTLALGGAPATLTSNAVTLTKYSAQVTSEALTTASGASQAFVITLSGVAATDLAIVSAAGGTNTRKAYMYEAVCTSNTVTVTVYNNHASALNGTLIFNLWILKA